MRAVFALLAAAWLFASTTAEASVIENGIYYSSAEPGRGYSIEQQGGQMTLIFYVYDTSGGPVWYYATGGYTLNGTGYPTMTAAIGRYTGGQCLGCTFSNPTGTNVGTVTVAFSSAQRATLTLGASAGAFGSGGGTAIALERFGFSDSVNPLLGQWAFAYSIANAGGGAYGNTFGEFVRFTTVGAPSGATGATGVVTGTANYYGECFNSGAIAGQCLILYATSSLSAAHYITRPLNEWRGTYQIVTGSNTKYRSQGVRVAVPGEAALFGASSAAFDATSAADGPLPDQSARVAADARAGVAATAADPGPVAEAQAAALQALLAHVAANRAGGR